MTDEPTYIHVGVDSSRLLKPQGLHDFLSSLSPPLLLSRPVPSFKTSETPTPIPVEQVKSSRSLNPYFLTRRGTYEY